MFVKEVNNWIFQKKLKQESRGKFISIYVERTLMKPLLCSWHLTDAFSLNLPKNATIEASYSPPTTRKPSHGEGVIHPWPDMTALHSLHGLALF